MKRTLTTLFLAHALVLSTLGPAARAQQLDQTTKVKAEVVDRLNKKEGHVKVKLRNGSEVKGHITQTSENGFTVANEKTSASTDIAYADVQNVEGRGMSKKKKILIGVGIGAGIFIALTAYAIAHLSD